MKSVRMHEVRGHRVKLSKVRDGKNFKKRNPQLQKSSVALFGTCLGVNEQRRVS